MIHPRLTSPFKDNYFKFHPIFIMAGWISNRVTHPGCPGTSWVLGCGILSLRKSSVPGKLGWAGDPCIRSDLWVTATAFLKRDSDSHKWHGGTVSMWTSTRETRVWILDLVLQFCSLDKVTSLPPLSPCSPGHGDRQRTGPQCYLQV